MERKLKSWQGWLLFIGAMVVVFAIGMCVAALMERRAEVASVFNNRRTPMSGIVARNDLFKDDFPRGVQYLGADGRYYIRERVQRQPGQRCTRHAPRDGDILGWLRILARLL